MADETDKFVYAYWAGKMAILSQGLKEVGRVSRPVYTVGVVFDVTNDAMIAGVDSTFGNPSAEQLEKMERSAVGTLAAVGGGILATELTTAALIGFGVGGPVGSVVTVAVAGAVGIATALYGDVIYDTYKTLQRHAFDIIDSCLNPVPRDISDTGFSDMIAPWTDLFDTSQSFAGGWSGSPLILDLDGDGIETIGLNAGAYFDHDVNGFAEQTGWVKSDDGLLVMDRDQDGIIENGMEVFGNNTILQNEQKAADGFQALAELDNSLDGRIDINDTAWTQLKVWRDFDGDGYSSFDEMYTLDELGVKSINTSSLPSSFIDPDGNEHNGTGSFTWVDDTTATMTDVWFKTDKTYTIANEWVGE